MSWGKCFSVPFEKCFSVPFEKSYDALFDLSDEEDARYHKVIKSLDYEPFKELLLEIVNGATIPPDVLAKYKWDEKELGREVFDWSVPLGEPTRWVGVNMDVLSKDAIRYYLVIMAFENFWGVGLPPGRPELPSVWIIIPD